MKHVKRVLPAYVIAMGLSASASAQDRERCDEIRHQIDEKGLLVDVTFQATELFDATQVINYSRVIKVEPNVGLPRGNDGGPILIIGCGSMTKLDGSVTSYGFTLGKDARLDIDGRKLAAAIPANVRFITEVKRRDMPWTPALHFSHDNDAFVEIYHAVAAELMQGFEFDTWESAGASNFSRLFELPDTNLPAWSAGGKVLGIAGRGNKLYQVAVQRYSMDIAP